MIPWVEKMESVRNSGAFIALVLGQFGWSCSIKDADDTGVNVAGRPTPDIAVDLAFERWAAKRDALAERLA